jgi:predicted kinase
MSPTGTESTRLMILRGNSGSGKSSIAAAVRQAYGRRGFAIVGQDLLRRNILREQDVAGGANIDLIDLTARFALDRGYHVIVEGILYTAHYGEMLERLIADHRGGTRCYYMDIPFEETLRRHATKPQANEYGAAEMERWFNPLDLLPATRETIIPASQSFDESVSQILRDSGLEPILPGDEVTRYAGKPLP